MRIEEGKKVNNSEENTMKKNNAKNIKKRLKDRENIKFPLNIRNLSLVVAQTLIFFGAIALVIGLCLPS